jgi:hypothetical protein
MRLQHPRAVPLLERVDRAPKHLPKLLGEYAVSLYTSYYIDTRIQARLPPLQCRPSAVVALCVATNTVHASARPATHSSRPHSPMQVEAVLPIATHP